MKTKANERKLSGRSNLTLIGEDAQIEGSLRFFGTARIDGDFKGAISGADTITIGMNAIVESDINVPNITIDGEVHGNIIAERKVELRKSGKVFGDIQAPSVKMDRGAILQGNCKIGKVKYTGEEKAETLNSVKPPKAQKVAVFPKAS